MRNSRAGYAGALLVLAALLSGGLALWTAPGPVAGQEEPPASPPAAAEAAPEETTQAATESPPATGMPSGQPLEAILSQLATGGEIPEDLRDPAFDYYVDLSLLGHAWAELDAPLLTDLALQFVEGERVLLRSHRAMPATHVMQIAIRTAAVKFDQETLARLDKAAARLEDEQLAAELSQAREQVAEGAERSAWMLPVATTTAAEFARYKGVLQDIEAAIVTRDRTTLESLQAELESTIRLPAEHRQKLESRISTALEDLGQAGPALSEAAQVLDKLAHSTRSNWPPSGLHPDSGLLTPGGGGGGEGFVVTQTPQSPTQCQAVSTACPQGSVATQCPAVLTRCPINVTRCPLKITRCPSWTTVCPPESCQQPTQRSVSPTQCQQIQTQCAQVPTQCGQVQTQCAQVPTQCGQIQTQCAQVPTQCAQVPTQCGQIQTQCAQVPTQCLQVPTQCRQSPTQCQQAPTHCKQQPTTCTEVATQCQQVPTRCVQVPTECPRVPTQCVQVPTQCSPAQGKCERPTLVPYVPTQCPAIQTQCPYSLTWCPPSCGQQQQQKQRWIPPRKGKFPPGSSYQQPGSQGIGDYPVTPYPRRYEATPYE